MSQKGQIENMGGAQRMLSEASKNHLIYQKEIWLICSTSVSQEMFRGYLLCRSDCGEAQACADSGDEFIPGNWGENDGDICRSGNERFSLNSVNQHMLQSSCVGKRVDMNATVPPSEAVRRDLATTITSNNRSVKGTFQFSIQ